MDDLDLAMLDASEWQDPPAPLEPESLTTWRDTWPAMPSPTLVEDHSAPWVDTGASSDDRAQWLEARRSGIGASEAAAVMGEDHRADAGTVYARKVRPAREDQAEWMEWGHRLEPVIVGAYASPRYADRYSARDGRLLRSLEHPWAICTLDAWTYPDGTSGPAIPLEVKTDADRYGYQWDDGPPPAYVWQLQHQMLVTGAARASIVCLLGGSRLVWCDVERDETMIRRLVRAGAELWDRVQRFDPPPTRDHDALASIFPREDDREIELSGIEWTALDVHRCEASVVARRARQEVEDLDARIKRAMGTAARARLDDGTIYRWTTQRDGRRVLRRKEVER